MPAGSNTADTVATTADRRRDRRTHTLLALITALGLALRLWGIAWSLPDARHPLATYHPDELVNLGASAAVDIPHGQLDTGFYNYGTFYFYMVSLAQTVGHGYHWIPSTSPDSSGSLSGGQRLIQQAPERAGMFLAGRLVTALLGAATVPVVFLLGTRLYHCRAGLLGALFYAIAPLAVVHAHFLTVDVPATLFVTLALFSSAQLNSGRGWRDVVLAGVWCGVAAATKYTAVVVVAAPLTALIVGLVRSSGNTQTRNGAEVGLKVAAVLLVMAVVFLIACPGVWLNWNVFWNGTYPGSGVRYELFQHSREGHGYLFTNTGFGWWYHVAVSLRFGLGPGLLILSAAGFVYACLRREAADWVLIVFIIALYGLSSLSAVRFARYLIPLYPALSILAARLVFAPLTPGASRAMLAMGGAACPVLTLLTSIGLVHAMCVEDPRDRAADFLRRTAKTGSTVAFAHIPWFYTPPLSPSWGNLGYTVRARGIDETGQFLFRMPEPGHDWDPSVLAASETTNPPDYVVLSSFELQHEARRLRQPQALAFVQDVELGLPVRNVFAPPFVLGVDPNDVDLPQDLQYVLPVITVYAHSR